ncbi:MAG: MupG family TIM beta-alpha barrel fold protein [Synergistaceae bacterium]|nr:MupG family TIM beta-alpha barrel fold protein [Synergistaceae bacterium]
MNSKIFGPSVYVSTFENQRQWLGRFPDGATVFTSFQIPEEAGSAFRNDAHKMMKFLQERNFNVIASVSPKSLEFFGEGDLVEFALGMGIRRIRFDCGFSVEEMTSVAAVIPATVNASVIDLESAIRIQKASPYELYAIHNFYPRPETGLDRDYFERTTKRLQGQGIKVMAFFPGDTEMRGPVFEGLPTLEPHRSAPPYVACMELLARYGLNGAIVGDMGLSERQSSLIFDTLKDGEIRLPCALDDDALYDRPFTVRVDSPAGVLRLAGSRECASAENAPVEPKSTIQRDRGCVTMDNSLYARYHGEIQVIRHSLPADRRVNVIGSIDARCVSLLESVQNGRRIRLVRNNKP